MVHRAPPAAAALLALALAPAPARGQEGGPAPAPPAGIVVRRWLALDAVDRRARVPFPANAPFAKHLLDRFADPPEAGETVRGDLAGAAWRPVEAEADGTVRDPAGSWFYGEIGGPEAGAEAVHLAHLGGAAAFFVNGAGFAGDVYRLGTGPVPVALRPGKNRLFVSGVRGSFRLVLEPWRTGRSPILPGDATLPDPVGGEREDSPGAVSVVNPRDAWTPGDRFVRVEVLGSRAGGGGGPLLPHLPPLGIARIPFPIRGDLPEKAGREAPLRLQAFEAGDGGRAAGPPLEFGRTSRAPGDARRVTFVSRIDGSVQSYGHLPPAEGALPPGRIGTVLSLHGAGVDALDQARAHAPKPDFRIVCPSNRGPYGFDWQDWGRTDAYEVLEDALERFGGDPERVFLAGHSMGGHGVWHLAANDPDRWAAIAPSAGWCSFDTYGGPRPVTELTPLWRACDGGSRTEDLVANLVPLPTLVLHGTEDGTVPLAEAEGMLDRLREAGGKPLHRFQEGAGHWWDLDPAPGADCVDGPWVFGLFRSSARRTAGGSGRPSPGGGFPAPGAPVPAGPFRRAFDNRFVLVIGTEGTDEETRELLELARFHAGQWRVRANGDASVVRDSDLRADPLSFRGRNLILYGNEGVNAAWGRVLPVDFPVRVRRGRIEVGGREWKGHSLGAVFVAPRIAGDPAFVGAFASTGPRGTRLGYALMPFVSGVGYPDYAVFGEEFLRSGDGGVLAAGWFDARWRLQPGGFLREEGE